MYLNSKDFEALPYPIGCEDTVYNQKDIKIINDELIAKRCKLSKLPSIEIQYGKPNDTFAFPIERLYIDDLYSGYVMQYIKGLICAEVKFSDFKEFLLLVEKVKKDLPILINNNIVTWDLHEWNCIFNDQFRFIDTTDYFYSPQLTEKELIIKNYINFNEFFKERLFGKEPYCILNLLYNKKIARLKNKLLDENDPIFFDEFLLELMGILKIRSVDEISKKMIKYR